MDDLLPFGGILLAAGLALLVAVGSNRIAEHLRVPAPALFLIVAAIASDLVPRLGDLDVITDQRIVTAALVLILFDGGVHIGWRRMKPVVGAVAWIGIAGTAVTTVALALAVHTLFDFGWLSSLLIATALAPTDPAVVFSVLGRREIKGRSGTLLEGESGANDPVGIALMVSLLGAGTSFSWHAVGEGFLHFALQLGVGAVVGLLGGWAMLQLMRHVPLPNAALYPLQVLAATFAIFGLAAVLEGSGFLAVLLAGIVVGDARAPYKREIEQFTSGLASLSEIVAFVVLGLSVDLGSLLTGDRLWVGLGVAALLIVVIRPVLVGLVIAPIRLTRGERGFVLFSGLKGAVPILLGTYVLAEGVADAAEIYDIVFVVVLVSVVLQGGLVPAAAGWFKVPMRVSEPEPWALGMRFRDEPEGLHRYVVAQGSPADGCTLSDLDVGESFWVSLVSRDGRLVQVRGDTVLRAGDEVLALAEDADPPDTAFASRPPDR